uniref:Peptidase M13 N-terminal domain-containing protein n=1 Tax=Romanomermis culicivorax TaxID=13658 RepID=A0A915JG33_ROMCU
MTEAKVDQVGKLTMVDCGQKLIQIQADAKENCHCVTQGCVLAAVNLLNSIDTNVDPCQNFYQFACGKWKKDNPIPDEKSSHGPFNIAAKKVAQQLRTLLEDDSDGNTTNSIRFTKALYKACMDLDALVDVWRRSPCLFIRSILLRGSAYADFFMYSVLAHFSLLVCSLWAFYTASY